jgi:drug/metabolite transporter (DMT)-like permease
MNQRRLSYLLGIVAVLLWSTVATAFKITLRYLSLHEMLFYSSMFSFLVLGSVLLVSSKISELKSVSKKDHLNVMILGLINPFIYYFVLFKAYSLLPAQEAQALNYTWAITFALLAVPFLKQKLGLGELIAIALSYLGVLIIATHGDLTSMKIDSPTGVSFALGSTIIWSLFWLKNIKLKLEPVVALFLSFTWGSLFCGIWLFGFNNYSIPSWQGVSGAIYIGFFEMGVTFLIWLNALAKAPKASNISSLIFLSPLISLIFISQIAKEPIGVSSLFGLGFILTGFILQMKFSVNRKK